MWTHGTIIKELLLTTRKLMALKSREKKSLYSFLQLSDKKGFCSSVMIKNIPGHALGIWICGCSLFYRRELWASKSAGAKGDVPKIYEFVHPLHPC